MTEPPNRPDEYGLRFTAPDLTDARIVGVKGVFPGIGVVLLPLRGGEMKIEPGAIYEIFWDDDALPVCRRVEGAIGSADA